MEVSKLCTAWLCVILIVSTSPCLSLGAVRTRRDLFSLSGVIRCVTGRSALLMYNNYGCFCGRGGWGAAPVDDTDRCCVAHDNCYALPSWFGGIFILYSYRCEDGTVTCTSRSALRRRVCECDKALAECFARSTYNPQYKNYQHCGLERVAGTTPGTITGQNTSHVGFTDGQLFDHV
ncbi:basic phospholipase A2 acanthin-2-like [Branchiostoma floridae x Branchiostoma japonicum]